MTDTDRIKVLLADDHRMMREALKAVLEPTGVNLSAE